MMDNPGFGCQERNHLGNSLSLGLDGLSNLKIIEQPPEFHPSGCIADFVGQVMPPQPGAHPGVFGNSDQAVLNESMFTGYLPICGSPCC